MEVTLPCWECLMATRLEWVQYTIYALDCSLTEDQCSASMNAWFRVFHARGHTRLEVF